MRSARKLVAVLACAALFACGGGGGGGASGPALEPLQEQVMSVGLLRGDAPTAIQLVVTKPFEEAGTLELLGEPTGAFEPEPLPIALTNAKKCLLTVAFTPPSTPPDPHQSGSIPLLFRRDGGGAAFPVTLRLDGTIETPSARLLPTHVELGTAAVGETVPFTVTFENASAVTPVSVSRLTIDGDRFSLAPDAARLPTTVAPGGRLALLLRYVPLGESEDASVLRVFHSASDDPLEATLEGAGGVLPRVVHDFGFVPLDPLTSESPWLEIHVAPEATGILVEAWGVPDASLELVGSEGPDGEAPVDWLATYPAGEAGCLNVQLPDPGIPEARLATGTYRFRVRDAAGTGADVRVRAIVSQRRAGEAHEGTLDLRVFVAQGLGIADPAGDANLAGALRTIDAVLGASGIRIGAVEFVPLDPRFDVLEDGMARVNMLMVATTALPEGPLNLFLVRGMADGIAGFAALPGPLANATPFSGVVVGYEGRTAVAAGVIAAHEISHHLGHRIGHRTTSAFVLPHVDGARPALTHPLVSPSLPEELLAPPGSVDEALIQQVADSLAPASEWCGACAYAPVR
jgi:hypothetical protein